MTPQQERFILDNFQALTGPQIRKELRISQNTLSKFLQANNLKADRSRYYGDLTDEQTQYLKQHAEIMSPYKIAHHFGWTIHRCKHFIKRLGLTPYIERGRPIQEDECNGFFNVNRYKCWITAESSVLE
jgi:hypothetical protein